MKERKPRRWGITLFATMLTIILTFAFSALPAYAASRKTVSLIKDYDIKYYSSGLAKQINDGVVTMKYKYDSKGRIKEVRKYNCDDGMELENTYSFTYNKKGKLTKIIKRYYDYGKVVKKQKCGLKVDKNNRIIKLSFIDLFDYYKLTLQCKYDSKGRMKEITEVNQSLEDGETSVTNWYNERNSKGYITKSVQRLDSGDDYSFTHETKIKSGKVTMIKELDLSDNTTRTYKFKYTKKKINKKYVKAVKAQQSELLYMGSWWCLSPVYYLGQIN